MKDGFIKVAAITSKVKVADVSYNVEQICLDIDEAKENGAKIIVFPELCITSYTCQDLFFQNSLLNKAKEGLFEIVKHTKGFQGLIFVGLPYMYKNELFNVAAAISDGKLLAFIPKTHIPNYGEFYEARHFGSGKHVGHAFIDEFQIPFSTDILFKADNVPNLLIGCEICEDLWAPCSPSTNHCMNGATIVANLSASNEIVGKEEYRSMLVQATSGSLVCGYIYASAGDGESTQDLVFSGHNLIGENGTILSKSKRFEPNHTYAIFDIERLISERRKMTCFQNNQKGIENDYTIVPFSVATEETCLEQFISRTPFVPGNIKKRRERCEEILNIQSYGLKKRLEHTGSKRAVIGISGGLDSTLALLVTVRAFDLLGLDHKGIFAITMPCFGTTDRTYDNACELSKKLGCTLEEIDIKESVTKHFSDIGHDINNHDVTYENGQARERTQVLMDIANRENGLVIGTGDMSELALGWATYNGDHMSMYGVNSSVPKTLVRHLVDYYADTCNCEELRTVLLDVLDTPVSPELLPPVDGVISQKTEDLVGPYELHDFYMYYMLRFGFSPAKIYRMAKYAFADSYSDETIKKWLATFVRRFFSQQFKRSCLPDGPKVGSVAVSPRGDLRMPSDASASLWLTELENLD